MNLTELLQKAHDKILDIQLEPLFLEEHQEKADTLLGTIDDLHDSIITVKRTLAQLRQLRGQITSQIVRLSQAEEETTRLLDKLHFEQHILNHGVTKIKINQQGFKGTPPERRKAERRAAAPVDQTAKALAALQRKIEKNPELLLLLKAAATKSATATPPTDTPEVEGQ